MSLMGEVQKFIESHPGCTSSDIANAFADFPRKSVLQSTSKLRQCGRVAHRFEGKTRRHFALETDIQPDQEPDKQADDPHHLIGHGQGGMGTKAHDLFVLPLCRTHHNELHADTVAFEEKYGSQLELIFRFIDRALAIGVLA